MNTPDSLNSSRPYDTLKLDKYNLLKELLNEKEHKLKDLTEKNEKLEKDCLKFQIQIKNVEDKLKAKTEKDYVTNTDTSSNFLLPSEFRKVWEDLAIQSLSDCYIDFYEDPIHSFHLIQEIFILCSEMFKEQIKYLINQILIILNIPKEKNNEKIIENRMKTIFQEFFNKIFETEKCSENFLVNISKKYKEFVRNQLKDFKKHDEFEDMIKSKSFKEMIFLIKKILLYIEFHDPPLNLSIDSFKDRKTETKKLKNSDCICVEGFIKDEKNCLILLNPPLMKNGFIYNGLKPVVIVYEANRTADYDTFNNISNISSCNVNNVVTTDPSILIIKNTSNPVENKTSTNFTNNFNNSSCANHHVNAHLKQFLLDSSNNCIIESNSNSYSNNSPRDLSSNNNSFPNRCSEKKLNSIPSTQRNFINNKNKITSEKVLNISDSLNFEMKINKSKEITFLRHSNEKENIKDKKDLIKNNIQDLERSKEKNFEFEIINGENGFYKSNYQNRKVSINGKGKQSTLNINDMSNENVNSGNKNYLISPIHQKDITTNKILNSNLKYSKNSSIEKKISIAISDKKIRQISLDAGNLNSNNSFNLSYNNVTSNLNTSNGDNMYNNFNKILSTQAEISDQAQRENSFNYKSTSHHNLFAASAIENKKNRNSKKNKVHNKEYPSVSKTSFGDRNSNSSHIQNFNGIITGNISAINEMKLKSYEKSENILQSSRSQFESNNEEYIDNLYNDLDENTAGDDDLVVDNEYYFDNIQLATEYNSKDNKKIISSIMSNSFNVNKNNDLINTMSQIDLGSLKILERDNSTNTSEINNKNILNKNKIANILINNSEKKLNKGNLYLYQSTERGGFEMNSLTKTIDKFGAKVNPIIYRSGIKKNIMRSFSKTPKQNKARVIGYSPRTNIHYIFNDKQIMSNNFIIKVSRKSINHQKFTNCMDDKINSKNSSVSRERKSQNNMMYQTPKTIDDQKVKENKSKNNSSKILHDVHKYKDFIKNKVKVCNLNSNNTNINNNTNNINSTNNNSNNTNFIFQNKGSNNSQNATVVPQQTQQIQPKNSKNNFNSYQKTYEENTKKKIIQKDYNHNSAKKTANKSIDRRVLTNAQTKISVEELLSFKKPSEKNIGSPTNVIVKEKTLNYEKQYSKTNFLNIKYV